MKNTISLYFLKACFVAIMLCWSTAHAQVIIDQTMTPEELVQDILLGEGIQVFNVTFNGFIGDQVNNQIGRYEGPSDFVDFDEGIVMASGDVIQATGGFGAVDPNITGDPDMLALANAGGTSFSVNNCAILEFDFIPSGDSLTIRFVFTSQEYPGFTCSNYNDPFGFFISGPGINGPYSNNAINIATIPGSETPIAVNTINGGVPTGGGTVQNCLNVNPNFVEDSQYFVNNNPSQPNDIQFPGMTVTLTARAEVICGELYHIKLAIADASDSALDSGVFLEKGGFQSHATVTINASPVAGGIEIGENDFNDGILAGCSDARFCLSRNDTIGIDTAYFEVGGSATAGVQYILPEEEYVVFQEGVDTICFDIISIANDLGAQVDSLIFTASSIDECTGDTIFTSASIAVYNEYTFDVDAEDVIINCPTEFVNLTAIASQGLSPYIYDWALESDPDNILGQGSTFMVEPPEGGGTDTYIVSVTDYCGLAPETTTVSVTDNTQPDPVVFTSPNDTINCVGQTVELTATGSLGFGDLEYFWSTGDEDSETTVSPDGSQTITWYTITVTDECGVTGTDSVAVYFIPLESPVADAGENVSVVCAGDEVTLTGSAEDGAEPYQYQWQGFDPGQQITVNPFQTEVYFLVVTDDCGGTSQMDSVTVTVPVYDPITINLPSPTSVCEGDAHVLAADVDGGAGNFDYDWLETGSSNSSITVSPGFGQHQYTVTVTDQCGTVQSASTIVTVPVYDPIVVTPGSKPSCTGDAFTLSVTDISGGAGTSTNDFFYLWEGPGLTDSTGFTSDGSLTLSHAEPGLYTVFVTDVCGNAGTADVDADLIGIEFIPNIITPNNGDNVNDQFVVPSSSIFDTKVTILDRWGKVAFENDRYVCDQVDHDDPSTLINGNCWDGDDKKGDVFYYIIDIDNGVCTFQGTLHILDNN